MWIECTDKRDKVYGLLGLAHSSFAGVISPNYALSLADVYKDVMLAYLQHDVRLEPLRYCEKGLRQIDSCPSWVPDWSTVTDQRLLAGQVACGVSRANAEYISPGILVVTGIMCGAIACVGGLAPLSDGAQIATTIRSWEPEGLRTRLYAHGGTLLDAFVTTICRNNLAERIPEYNYPTIQSWKQTYLDDISQCPENVVLDRLGKPQIFRCLTVCAGKRFIVTDQGHIGLGPSDAKPGKQRAIILFDRQLTNGQAMCFASYWASACRYCCGHMLRDSVLTRSLGQLLYTASKTRPRFLVHYLNPGSSNFDMNPRTCGCTAI